MSSIQITIDVSKINKAKIGERKYTNRENKEVVVKEYKTELVEMKEPKVITSGADWVLKKTHFLVEAQTKEEKASKAKSVYIGEGFTFFKGSFATGEGSQNHDTGASEDINPNDIPF